VRYGSLIIIMVWSMFHWNDQMQLKE
jgi:hypothetical protein